MDADGSFKGAVQTLMQVSSKDLSVASHFGWTSVPLYKLTINNIHYPELLLPLMHDVLVPERSLSCSVFFFVWFFIYISVTD